jgi:5-methylcytosine-specific restriction endonuclease McrA
MPDRDVKTVRDQIYFQYAKLIARSAFKCRDGKEAKAKYYGFIKKTFKELQSGRMSWSDILREDRQTIETDKECIYCGSKENLSWEHIVPKSLKINPRCPECDKLHGIHNQIYACRSCNSKKSTTGLYKFYKKQNPDEKKFFDIIPAILEKKYLKTIYCCHECAGNLDKSIDGISVIDLDLEVKA